VLGLCANKDCRLARKWPLASRCTPWSRYVRQRLSKGSTNAPSSLAQNHYPHNVVIHNLLFPSRVTRVSETEIAISLIDPPSSLIVDGPSQLRFSTGSNRVPEMRTKRASIPAFRNGSNVAGKIHAASPNPTRTSSYLLANGWNEHERVLDIANTAFQPDLAQLYFNNVQPLCQSWFM